MLWWLWQSRAPSTILVTFSTHANSDVRFGECLTLTLEHSIIFSPKSSNGVSVRGPRSLVIPDVSKVSCSTGCLMRVFWIISHIPMNTHPYESPLLFWNISGISLRYYGFLPPDFFCKENIFWYPLIVSVISKDPGNEQISTSRCDEIFLFFSNSK